MTEPPPLEPEGTLGQVLGFEYDERGDELARGHFAVRDAVRQPMGIVHGGAYAAMAESIASITTWEAVQPDNLAMGLSNATSFLRPVSEGTIHVAAHRRHRGRTTWIWDIDFTDDEGRLCATSRVTMAVRPAS